MTKTMTMIADVYHVRNKTNNNQDNPNQPSFRIYRARRGGVEDHGWQKNHFLAVGTPPF